MGLFRLKPIDSSSQKPVPRGTDFEIPLSDANLDITQMNLSYFQIGVDIQLDLVAGFKNNALPNLVNATEELKTLWKIHTLVGYKHTLDAIPSAKALHRNKKV
jgi:hypothetical protein